MGTRKHGLGWLEQGEDFSLERMNAQNNQRTILTVCWLCYDLAANVWRPGVEVEGAD